MDLKKKLGKEIIFFDGGMGTMLQGLAPEAKELPEELNITRPQLISSIHTMYLEAGANVITANTFGAYRTKFENTEEIIAAAMENAQAACKSRKDAAIALDLGPTGKLLKPMGDLPFEDCYTIFKESAVLGEKYGADLAVIETISDTYEAKAAVLAVKENTKLPILCTFSFDEAGHTLTGGDIPAMVALLEGLGVDALGLNCGLGPKQMEALLPVLLEYSSLPVMLQPNAGLPKITEGRTCYDLTAKEFAEAVAALCKKGAWILGGCCGTTPEHIREMIKLCANISPPAPAPKNLTMVSSYAQTVIIGDEPVIIGERINPTGKKKFKQALIEGNMDYIINEAFSQKEAGAHILDVNVGLPDIDEEGMMLQTVERLQELIRLPLQIDTGSSEVMEKALRLYNGKAMINSVNAKKESMEAVFPIAKKYGGVVVGLTLDERGIPETAEERFKLAEKIINTAADYGIDKKNILIDPLTLTVGAQQKEAGETLKALGKIKEELGVGTILGLSNISFGLPNREFINTSFFAMALQAGLDGCIMNPLSKEMMGVARVYNMLAGHDEGCRAYMAAHGEKQGEEEVKSRLYECVVNGLKEEAYGAAKDMVSRFSPLEIINGYLLPALDYVVKQYEGGSFFLPQLVVSAEAAKRTFDALKEEMEKTGVKQETRGKIILATVEGDIHDIGKNIVAALLSNYGYEVIDLGKNVEAGVIVERLLEEKAGMVGLSALITTTVLNMEKTIVQIKEAASDCKVVVGGAVLNEEYAKAIGADYYGRDALAAVSIAEEIFGELNPCST